MTLADKVPSALCPSKTNFRRTIKVSGSRSSPSGDLATDTFTGVGPLGRNTTHANRRMARAPSITTVVDNSFPSTQMKELGGISSERAIYYSPGVSPLKATLVGCSPHSSVSLNVPTY